MALLEELTENAAQFLTPIAGAKPVGNDPSYEPAFERVKAEIDKLTALSGGTPAWGDVVSGSEGLLREKAKDLRLCVWGSVAQFRSAGIAGFARGFLMTSKLCAQFWEGMYPDRPRARANLVAWLSEQAAADLMAFTPSAADRAPLEVIETVYGELDTLLSEKLGQVYPGMGGLRSAVREKLRQVPQDAPPPPPPPPIAPVVAAPPPVATATAPAPAAAASGGFSAPEVPVATNAEDAIVALRAVGQAITSAAKHLRKADPADVFPYRLQRTGAWLVVRAAPPVEGRATRIPPPPVEARKRLAAQLAEQQWLALLTSAEDLTGSYLFWFDLHRMVALAMDRLGVQFAAARETVGREVVAFVTRNPTLPKLTFADGSPFADAATETWLAEETQKWAAAGGASAGPSAASAEDEELAKRFEEAREMVVGGKVPEGLALAVQLASRGADARTRFRARLSVAKLAISGGKPEVARPILEGLLAEADRHQLEDWEPELCASLLSALFLCRKATSKPGSEEDLSWSGIFNRLCRLDPASALRLSAG